jgi:hypothetical protein
MMQTPADRCGMLTLVFSARGAMEKEIVVLSPGKNGDKRGVR